MTMAKCNVKIILVGVAIFLLIALQPFAAFFMDVYFNYGQDYDLCVDCNSVKESKSSDIPLIIHQVFFGVTEKEIPQKWKLGQESWSKLNPDFKYILWNASAVEELVATMYPKLLDTYHSYGHWVQRADVSRYVILHQYGGIYADLDLECLKSLTDVFKTFPKEAGVILYDAYPGGVASDFIISKQNHPFMASVIQGLKRAHRWFIVPYARPMFTTGPMYFGGRFKAFKNKEDIFVFNNFHSYVHNNHGGSWHSADGELIYFLYGLVTKSILVEIALCICIIMLPICVIYIKCRSRFEGVLGKPS